MEQIRTSDAKRRYAILGSSRYPYGGYCSDVVVLLDQGESGDCGTLDIIENTLDEEGEMKAG
jgi:hypothetical protein